MKRAARGSKLRYSSDSERGSELDKPVSFLFFFPLRFRLLYRDEIPIRFSRARISSGSKCESREEAIRSLDHRSICERNVASRRALFALLRENRRFARSLFPPKEIYLREVRRVER